MIGCECLAGMDNQICLSQAQVWENSTEITILDTIFYGVSRRQYFGAFLDGLPGF